MGYNHLGEHIKAASVDPLVALKDVERVRRYFLTNYKQGPLYGLVWTLGCNMGLRVGDILQLKAGQLMNQTHLTLIESKTGKQRTIYINDRCSRWIKAYFAQYLFFEPQAQICRGKKGWILQNKALHKLIKHTCRELKIDGNYGTHTMRKTFAYHAYTATLDLSLVQNILNHSEKHVTRSYVGKNVIINSDPNLMRQMSHDEVYAALDL
jgi:integrase